MQTQFEQQQLASKLLSSACAIGPAFVADNRMAISVLFEYGMGFLPGPRVRNSGELCPIFTYRY